jgi:hypothetical protein
MAAGQQRVSQHWRCRRPGPASADETRGIDPCSTGRLFEELSSTEIAASHQSTVASCSGAIPNGH